MPDTTEYVYNQQDDLVEMMHTTYPIQRRYQYEYDAVGNWTKPIRRVEEERYGKKGMQTMSGTYRTITYYK